MANFSNNCVDKVDKLKIYAINTNSCLRSTIKNYKDYFCHSYCHLSLLQLKQLIIKVIRVTIDSDNRVTIE